MIKNEFHHFVATSSSAGFGRINVKRNENYAKNGANESHTFRLAVRGWVVPKLEQVKSNLIRDLRFEKGIASVLVFPISKKWHRFENEFLQRGGTMYLLDFIRGYSSGIKTNV